MSERPREPRAFLPTRLLRWSLAEILCLLGNLSPGRLAAGLWGWAVRLNPHQEVAAANRALALFERDDAGAWDAFEKVLEQLENPRGTSASDLYLSRTPGRVARRLAAGLLWGASAAPVDRQHDDSLLGACRRLAEGHSRLSLERGEWLRAERALKAWRSLAGDRRALRWAAADLAWRRGDTTKARALIAPLLERGDFASPLDAVRWAARLLDAGERDLARRSLEWARRWVPEVPRVWSLLGSLARAESRRQEALVCWERALALEPQDVDTFLARLEVERGEERFTAPAVALEAAAPEEMALGEERSVTCRLRGVDPEGWSLFPLPPAGWGLLPRHREIPFDPDGRACVALEARRPHRIRGAAWPLVLLAVGPGSHRVVRCAVRVPDREPGRVLVAVTEDHEIHEERGSMPAAMLRRLLVDKSRFAADLGAPWTHMVEAGSTLALLDWATEEASDRSGKPWPALRSAIRRHLAEEVARGHDLQPHLHAFNDPAYGHFPYALSGDCLETPLRFLLTAPDRRGDWASACPPSGAADEGALDRLASVERAVAQVEEVGRLGDPDYSAVLWRSGLLDYGAAAAARAWSAVALRRAGLWADSDLAKPGSPLGSAVGPAFFAGWEEPFASEPGGPLLQLPIAANLEGDYLMGPRLLGRRARRSVAALRGADGGVRPGVHLFTLLTHDKFLNARRGRDEFRLDPEYGDWRTARRHLAAWRGAGAAFVTAREGVEAVLDDASWHAVPRLLEETFLLSFGATREVRYRLTLLGRRIPASESWPRHVLVPVPCSLRRRLEEFRIESSDEIGSPELEAGGGAFWLRRTSEAPVFVTFRLSSPCGPALIDLERVGDREWRLVLESPFPFLNARVLVPGSRLDPGLEGAAWEARDTAGRTLTCREQTDGLLLARLSFGQDGEGLTRPLEIVLTGGRPLASVRNGQPPLAE